MKLFWAVAVGAALGGLARFYLATAIQQRVASAFPVGTLVINITGSFVLGVIMRQAIHSSAIGPELRALLTVGFCGGYTTFSTFSYDTAMMLTEGVYARAAIYMASSLVGSILATFAGFAVADLAR